MYIKSFLNQLSDIELMYFYQYRYDEFMPTTQEIIDKELQHRNIDKILITETIKKHFFKLENKNTLCPKCGSNKFKIEDYTKFLYGKGFTAEVIKQKFVCLVCNYQAKYNFIFDYLKLLIRLKKTIRNYLFKS